MGYCTDYEAIRENLAHYDALGMDSHMVTEETYPIEATTEVHFQFGEGFDINSHCYMSFTDAGHEYRCSWDMSVAIGDGASYQRRPNYEGIAVLLARIPARAKSEFHAGLHTMIEAERSTVTRIIDHLTHRLGGAALVERMMP